MISEATVKAVKYPPELIPDSWFGNVPLNSEFAPPVLDLKNFKPYVVSLSNIQVPTPPGPAANVLLRARYDKVQVEENTFALPNALVGAWNLRAKDTLYMNFFGVAAVPAYTSHYGLWVIKPTIAHKLLYGISLSAEEAALAQKLDIYSTVEKGLLPLPLSQQIEREYQVLSEETHSRVVTINANNTVFTIEHIYPNPGEIIVLTRVAAQPAAAANVVRLTIDRDRDLGFADVRTFPLSLVAGGEISCFIPATTEIRLTTQALVFPVPPHWFRYTFQRVKLTNILRARFGLASRDELPGDTFDKCLAGVL
jgi:hypothetical protein